MLEMGQSEIEHSITGYSPPFVEVFTMSVRNFASVAAGSELAGISSALLLSRIPLVTPDLHPFEAAYYNYQNELKRRLMWTFPKYYYFRKGTVAEREFVQAQKYPLFKRPGVWFPRGVPDLKHGRDRRFKEEVTLPKQQERADEDDELSKPVVFNSRVTAADEAGDLTSLERRLSRTLYLLIKTKGAWKFPSFPLVEPKPLHEAAEQGLREIGSVNMNTWTVSNTPTAVLKYSNGKLLDAETQEKEVEREYFIKSHIIGGDFQISSSDVEEFRWLTKEEVEQTVEPQYYGQLGHLLSTV
ncbi:unnamed protein product [Kuraishia capsulata CBS 1993]|uniref:Large ribosomal subunit protein mL46 n=1 Tax=Kuraishia capsulata CBS 1993 TaxID=1382522 RepID=W6MKG7_9ASCO|nr:uncharacterized protein KUCA_T00002835001 [Kuraishia capsulata CBS 1993]CDK26861.1 unnamed protein product [Kuraishia capsulata CBS 1993]